MRKTILFVFCMILMMNLIKSDQCGDLNPLWSKLEDFVNANTELSEDIRDEILAYDTQEPATMTEDNVGICADAVGYTSGTALTTCCTESFLQSASYLLRNSIGKMTDKRPPIFKAIQKLEEVDKTEKCGAFTKDQMDAYISTVEEEVEELAEVDDDDTSSLRALKSKRRAAQSENTRTLQTSDTTCPRQTWKCKDGTVLTTTSTCGFDKCPASGDETEDYCPKDQKRCGDGTFVSRTGDSCEFPECSTTATETEEANKPKDGPLKFFREMVMKCMFKTSIAHRRFLQGQICAFCYDAANFDDIASGTGDDATIIVEETSFESYATAASEGLACLQKVTDNLVAFVEAQSNLTSTTTKCKNVFLSFKQKMTMDDNKPCPTDDCETECKDGAEIFSDGCGEALDGDDADVTISSLRRRSARVLKRRQLTDVDSSSTGATAYVIDSDEEAYVSVGGISSSTTVTYEEYVESSSSILTFTFLYLTVIIALLF